MKTIKKITSATEKKDKPASSSKALLFELENLLLNEREIQFKAFASVMGKRDIKVTEMDFIRLCVDKRSDDFIPKILTAHDKTRISKEKLEEEMEAQTRELLKNKDLSPNKEMLSLIKNVSERGIATGALSHWDVETTVEIITRFNIDIPESNITSSARSWFSAKGEAWKQLTKAIGVPPSKCLALVTSSRSLKFSLYAGIPTIAIATKFTTAHDFGGSDMVIESLTSEAIASIIKALENL